MVYTNYSRSETIARKIDIDLPDARKVAANKAEDLEPGLRIYKAQAFEQLGVLADPETEERILEGYAAVEEDGYDVDQETIDGTAELLEGVEQKSRSLRVITGCAAFSQLRIDTNYSPEEDYLTQEDIARCFECSRVGLRETYTDVLNESNTRQVGDVWLISR